MKTGKYAVPKVSDIVVRDRLFELINQNSDKRLFLILGQAAQGKSTLIASYLTHGPDWNNNGYQTCTIWLHMNRRESDHVKLFEMIFNAFSKIPEKGEYFKNLKIPQTTLGPGQGIARCSEILISLFNHIDQHINIVLDDIESLEESASSYMMIQNIIGSIPDNITLFLLSRQMPPLSLEKMKMEKKAVVLGNDDLKFTLDETKIFFQKFTKSGKIDLSQIQKIQAATEGWAGGLTLVLESMRRSPDLKKLPEHLAKDAFSFFTEEIYSTLPASIKEFLMKTSIFEVIDPETLGRLFENIPGIVDILKELEKRNLFIQRVDSSGKWPVFRYNKLFKTFLKRALLRKINPDRYKAVNIEAGRIFEEKKEYEQALKYYIEAGALRKIGEIIKALGTDFVIKGRFSDLGKWMAALPNEMIWHDPWLIFYLTVTRRIKGGVQNIADFKIALALFEDNRDIRGQILCTAYLIEAKVFMRKPFARISNFIKKGEKLLKPKDTKLLFTWARALLWQQIGFGYIAGNGDILRGISACRNSIMLAGKIDNSVLKLNASIVMILGYVQAGDFSRAQEFLSKIQNLTKEGIHPEYRVLKNLVNIDFAMKKGDLELSCLLLEKSETDIEKFGLLFLYPGLLEAKAMYFIHTKNYKDALLTANYLSDFSTLEGNDFYRAVALGIKSVNLYHQKIYRDALAVGKAALKLMETAKRSDVHLFWTKQILGFTLLHNNNPGQAAAELMACLKYFENISSDLSYTETSLGLGLVFWNMDKHEKALKYLDAGIQKAAREKYAHFSVINSDDFIKSLILMHDHGDNKEAARDIYKLIIPAVRIETLGRFAIFKNNKPLGDINWEGSRPKLLLKAIVSHGGRNIPKEVLMEDIWPGASAKAGEKNFKINLHRLRKALEPNADTTFGYSYISHKSGLISLDPDLVSIDIDDFFKFCVQGEKEEKKKNNIRALHYYDKAIQLYKGDYFTEEPYVEWIFSKRDRIRIKYIDILQKKALIHENLNQAEHAGRAWQKILQTDPLFETAYQKLMMIYSDSGMRNRAVNVFEQCRTLFNNELDIDPGNETIKIYEKIKMH